MHNAQKQAALATTRKNAAREAESGVKNQLLKATAEIHTLTPRLAMAGKECEVLPILRSDLMKARVDLNATKGALEKYQQKESKDASEIKQLKEDNEWLKGQADRLQREKAEDLESMKKSREAIELERDGLQAELEKSKGKAKEDRKEIDQLILAGLALEKLEKSRRDSAEFELQVGNL